VASADGDVTEEELMEIRQIARELGFPEDEIAHARAAGA
jgi:tellurite resistance protein